MEGGKEEGWLGREGERGWGRMERERVQGRAAVKGSATGDLHAVN